ncbi:MAG: phosphatase PAP2 family protein [Nocardioides sp.]|uniref:phosphatase PAP2 family protein n=1 Tax=Nocardioides sp. TaxID=35761 RepID=UPI003F0C9E44
MPLGWAAVLLVVFGVLAALTFNDSSPLDGFDLLGRDAEDWADEFPLLVSVLHVVEVAFDTIAMTIYTVVIAALLLWKGHRRAAGYVVGVMITSTLANRLLKMVFDRDRPEWQWLTDLHETQSFPSGHATAISSMVTLLLVLVLMFVRRGGLRRFAYVLGVLLVLLVGLDRVLLGRHFPSDVIAGIALGTAVALVWLVVLSPLPRGHAVKEEPLVETFTSAKRLTVVLNPIKVEDAGQFRSIVTAMAAESGWSEPQWQYTTIEDPGTGMARAAIEGEADLVLVCGGDGTVREVCATLAGTGIPVGIIPAGTGNLLARNLDIPLYLRSAIDVGLNGQDRAIDLVEVSGDGFEDTHFMVMAGMGFDAAIMEGVNDDIKKKVGWLAYVISGLKSLMFPAIKVEISVDGGEFTTHRARTVVVGNVGYLQAGMPLLPDATIDDGQVDVVLLHPKKFLSWLPLAVRVLAKSQRTDELIDRFTGASVVVRAATDVPRQLDGDSVGAGKELRMECIHGRLLVRVPR